MFDDYNISQLAHIMIMINKFGFVRSKVSTRNE